MSKLRGIIPVIPIPFNDDESIDETSLRSAVRFAGGATCSAMCLPAFGSEFYKLSDAERQQVVAVAIDENRRKIPLVAQANHVSATNAAALAQRYESMGADLISVAVPRQFAPAEHDLLLFCGKVADAVSCPVLIQDFNPGGATIDVDFIATLTANHANVQYVKLEEPMLIEKLARIRHRIGDRVSLLSGWGGTYMVDTLAVGADGIMPGLAIADLLAGVWDTYTGGQHVEAYRRFSRLLPYLSYSLQNLEMFLKAEKTILVRRGVFRNNRCREVTRTLSDAAERQMEFVLNQLFVELRALARSS